MMRSACAFGVTSLLIVGNAKYGTFGSQGTNNFVTVENFATLKLCKEAMVARGVTVCGLEIVPEAKPLHTMPFRGECHAAVMCAGCGDGRLPRSLSYLQRERAAALCLSQAPRRS
jgi:hypothetical protein